MRILKILRVAWHLKPTQFKTSNNTKSRRRRFPCSKVTMQGWNDAIFLAAFTVSEPLKHDLCPHSSQTFLFLRVSTCFSCFLKQKLRFRKAIKASWRFGHRLLKYKELNKVFECKKTKQKPSLNSWASRKNSFCFLFSFLYFLGYYTILGKSKTLLKTRERGWKPSFGWAS